MFGGKALSFFGMGLFPVFSDLIPTLDQEADVLQDAV
jgi:hypothetical protein